MISQAASAAACRHSPCDVRSCRCALPDLVFSNAGCQWLRGRDAVLSTVGVAVAPLTLIRGLWFLLVWINSSRENVLIDSRVACRVCTPAWVHCMSPENKQFQLWTKMAETGDVPLVEESDTDNTNDNENGNSEENTPSAPKSAPTHDDPRERHEERYCMGATSRSVGIPQVSCWQHSRVFTRLASLARLTTSCPTTSRSATSTGKTEIRHRQSA